MTEQKPKIKLCFWAFLLVLLGLFAVYTDSQAAEPGDRVVLSQGTIYLIRDNARSPFPSPAVYFSYGFEFQDATTASAADLAFSEDSVVSYAEGTLVKDANPTVYLISEDKRLAFVSGQVFTDLGYSFENVLTDTTGFLSTVAEGGVISSSDTAHLPGTLVESSGTIYLITPDGRQGIPTLEEFNSRRYSFSDVVPANSSDLALTDEGLIGQEPVATPPVEDPVVVDPEPDPEPEPEPVVDQSPSETIKSGVIAAFPNRTMTFGFTSTDPQGDAITYTVDWGDGETSESSALSSGSKFTAKHSWRFIDDYTIKVTTTDSSGNSTITEFAMKVGSDPTEFGPVVTLISPNGGEEIAIGSAYVIEWKWNWIPLNTDEEVSILFNRGGSNRTIVENEDDQTYSWVVTGEGITVADNYRIVVLSEGTPGANVKFDDTSDGNFSLVSN